jgi:outer membrane receptor protein involved in Fe transport
MLTNEVQENPATAILDCAGYFGEPCDNDLRAATFSKNRFTGNVHYASGPLGLHLTWRWIEGTDNAAPLSTAGLGYSFSDDFSARLGVTNLLDNDPPMMADAVFDNNTDAGLFDIFGRSYYLTLSAHF